MAPFTVTLTLLDMPEKNAGSSVKVPEIRWAGSPSIVGVVFQISLYSE